MMSWPSSSPAHTLALAIVLLLSCAIPTRAQADEAVAVLGVRSLDGDTELERRLSTALRTSAASIERFDVSDRELSFEQMMLAHGCDEPEPRCLRDIAKTLTVERLFYGTVVEGQQGYELKVFSFTTHDGHSEAAVTPKLDPLLIRGTGAPGAVNALVRRLVGESEVTTGRLRVVGTRPGVEIFVDGVSRGVLDQRGMITVEVKPGKHFVLARPTQGGTHEEHLALVSLGGSVEVQLTDAEPTASEDPPEIERADLEQPAAPPPARPQTLRRALGWTSIGLGGVFAIATVYSWVRIANINDDPDHLAYRAAFPRSVYANGVGDVCREAEHGTLTMLDPNRAGLERTARDHCREGEKLEVLQYVFLGGTLLFGGVGTYLLWSSKKLEKAGVSLTPQVSAQRAVLEARLRF